MQEYFPSNLPPDLPLLGPASTFPIRVRLTAVEGRPGLYVRENTPHHVPLTGIYLRLFQQFQSAWAELQKQVGTCKP